MSGKPITPDEIADLKTAELPAEVFDAFNETIAKHWGGSGATFKQDEVAALIAKKTGLPEGEVYSRKWLDVEDSYRAAGWSVAYDKPGYNEDYSATFTFARKRR